MRFIRLWRLRRLREALAMLTAAIDAEEQMMARSGRFYPIVVRNNAMELAKIKYRIEWLESKK